MPPKRPSSPGPYADGTASAKSAATLNRERARNGLNGQDEQDPRGQFEDDWEDEFEEEEAEDGDSEFGENDDENGENETGVENQVDGQERFCQIS